MSADPDPGGETEEIPARYARRSLVDPRYSLANPAALAAMQERQRAMLALLRRQGRDDLATITLLEVGSGSGGNLLELLWLGFAPAHLAGIELLPERHAAARTRLPEAVSLTLGDASVVNVTPASVDIVYASTVFSSLLDDAFQQRLADAMWRAVKPGGGVLWYDFTVGNPSNRDVRGVPLGRVRELFPEGAVQAGRVTLAPPLARRLARLDPRLYAVANAFPLLRTHVLAWIAKPLARDGSDGTAARIIASLHQRTS